MSRLKTINFRTKHIAMMTLVVAIACIVIYTLTAYAFVPSAWRFVERRHPGIAAMGTRAFTANGIPGDPLNIAFIGTEEELLTLMRKAGWFPADPITLKSALRIAVDSVAHKPYPDAPVSDLFVGGKKQNLAFEFAEGGDPSKRHHVRFWKSSQQDALNRPLWMGAATYDRGVGLSHTTGQITHHISADVDGERNKLIADLKAHANSKFDLQWIEDFQPTQEGKNGGGDYFYTDRKLALIQKELGIFRFVRISQN